MNLERTQLGLLAALAATLPVSIFASETLLALSLAVLAARLAAGRLRLLRTPVDTPLLALVVWTLLAASFAQDPARSHEDAKKLLLYALFYLAVEVLAREEDREPVLQAALLGGLALAGLMVAQHLFLGYDRLDRRPPGFLGHYMSASGATMGVLVLAVGRLALGPGSGDSGPSAAGDGGLPAAERRAWWAGLWLPALVLAGVGGVAAAAAAGHAVPVTRACVAALAVLAAALSLWRGLAARAAAAALPVAVVPVAAWALVVSQTRSAWIGALVGLSVLCVLRAPRFLWLVAATTAAFLVLRPAAVTERLTLGDASTSDRIYMWQAGLDMVLDRPVFGQGPGMVLVVYPRYRWPEATHPMQPHLHNNFLQVAAERGVPGLVFFLWWAAAVFVAAIRETRRAAAGPPGPRWAAGGALAALAAVFAAGLFEYNLGDSEVLMLVLLLAAVPFALRQRRAAA
ncbi:MAG TPA: O-antigen ligase family protein [Vicinamibacteria bacterium]|nr:O-antigen ligase family protein [Vicinamibacteria bacterium]